ncbi:hypothetical protein BGZ83_010460 [Gryganskiella cystojenkinii]|nr:hypothetical protein BGZ83_010460 [Gryganskiella cystojenkinii]
MEGSFGPDGWGLETNLFAGEEADSQHEQQYPLVQEQQQQPEDQLQGQITVVTVITEISSNNDDGTKDPFFDGADHSRDDEDEDEVPDEDGLPTLYNDNLLPPESRQELEFKVGAQALDSFLDPASMKRERNLAIGYVLRQANNAYRNQSVYSVVRKPASKIPPSEDPHDYSSLARYFWRNPNTKDGLPYVRWDGKPNPDMDSVEDYRLLRKVFRDCHFLGQAYFWTGEERYAEKIVYRVKEWFLDDETKMNPNLKYASLIFGHDLGRAQGVLDMFKIYGMFDALKLIERSKAMASEPTLIPDLQAWFFTYLDWIDGSVQANQERKALNNHGTYFSVQYISILEFLGRTEQVKQHCEEAKETRIRPQLQFDGAQPHETARPISFFYSTFNLQGLMLLAMQAEVHGVDLWHYKAPMEEKMVNLNKKTQRFLKMGGATIEDAVWYLSDYAVRDVSEWPYPDSGTRSLSDVLKMARVANLVYGQNQKPWKEMTRKLERKIEEEKRAEEETEEEDTDEGEESKDEVEGKGKNDSEDGAEGGEGASNSEEGELSGFLCELGILSKATLWHCYK